MAQASRFNSLLMSVSLDMHLDALIEHQLPSSHLEAFLARSARPVIDHRQSGKTLKSFDINIWEPKEVYEKFAPITTAITKQL